MKKAVIAIGGNSLIRDEDHISVADQYESVTETVDQLADMVEDGYEIVVTHGNGPQVGMHLIRSTMSADEVPETPIDSCDAYTQGGIGYLLQQAFGNEFRSRKADKYAVTMITQVRVDSGDSAFENPTKPVGPSYKQSKAQELQELYGWTMKEYAEKGFRRVVPSPQPQKIEELETIARVLKDGYVVIAVGGGGIPVIKKDNGDLDGLEAVIDKDRASSLLAQELGVDLFLISTGVEKVYLNFSEPDERAIDKMTVKEARKYMDEGHFEEGSMKPKIEAVISFLEGGGEEAIITSPKSINKALSGETGTLIVPE